MTTVSPKSRSSPMTSPIRLVIRFSKPCLIITLLTISISILFLAETRYKNKKQQYRMSSSSSSQNSIDTGNVKAAEVQMVTAGASAKSLSYYHCGGKFLESTMTPKDTEIILLHGAKFTKENWIESEIFSSLCLKGNENPSKYGRMSIVALDLSVHEDYVGLLSAFQALKKGGVISGKPAALVTPSASGKSIVSLLPMGDKESKVARSMLKLWIPVASPAVLGVKNNEYFASFKDLAIPILAMNGDSDAMGKEVTETLVKFADAKRIEMKGGHPCYLDSPEYFVDTLIAFLRGSVTGSL